MCPILQVISSVPSCKLVEETCIREFSMHFDYCTTASIDFIVLDEETFGSILQVNFFSYNLNKPLVLDYIYSARHTIVYVHILSLTLVTNEANSMENVHRESSEAICSMYRTTESI